MLYGIGFIHTDTIVNKADGFGIFININANA